MARSSTSCRMLSPSLHMKVATAAPTHAGTLEANIIQKSNSDQIDSFAPGDAAALLCGTSPRRCAAGASG